jgi:beta-N-acetylhexosaminidase
VRSRPAPRALIVGLGGPLLTPGERAYLAAVDPWGVILFARNVADPLQLRRLTAAIRDAIGRPDAPILVDQEGGRVQRLGPPNWPAYPSAGVIARLHGRDPAAGLEAARLAARLIASDLTRVGITVACLPVLDLPVAGADAVIGERAYGSDAGAVAALGRAAAEGVLAGGCLPVIKHIPGHGRARCDSHFELPRVETPAGILARTDFAPFRALSDMPLAMTAHVVFSAIDPNLPATVSPAIIGRVIRGEIGFDGLLMSDDLSMGALAGSIGERACRAIEAGCDVALHCSGDGAEMAALAASVPPLAGRSLERARRALACAREPEAVDLDRKRARLDALVDQVGDR